MQPLTPILSRRERGNFRGTLRIYRVPEIAPRNSLTVVKDIPRPPLHSRLWEKALVSQSPMIATVPWICPFYEEGQCRLSGLPCVPGREDCILPGADCEPLRPDLVRRRRSGSSGAVRCPLRARSNSTN
jgi:hypothetical protein